MLTAKDNFLQTIRRDGKPDRLVSMFDPFAIIIDPVFQYVDLRKKGETTIDRWGVTILWPEDQYAGMPHATAENRVCPDITSWSDYVTVPDLVGNCDDEALWKDTLNMVAGLDRAELLTMSLMPTGIFEQMHALMGFEDTLINLLIEPEYMQELAEAIGNYRLDYARLLVKHMKPDVVISMDDWGTKDSLFMQPEIWRKIIKPQYAKLYGYLKENGVIILHHADCYLEPLMEDLIELGVDVWQGAIPSNDIEKLQKQVDGQITIMGGIDSIIDRPDTPEEEIRAETRRACEQYGKNGRFIPSISYGNGGAIYPHVDPIMRDEIERFNEEHFGISVKHNALPCLK